MKTRVRFFLFFVPYLVVTSSLFRQDLIFSSKPNSFRIDPNEIPEVSGVTSSSSFANHLWVHEDSKRSASLILLTDQGRISGRFQLPFENRDWEDIYRGAGPVTGESYIYIADIGDNESKYGSKFIYRFKEPKDMDENVTKYDRIEFILEGGNRDCEAIFMEPLTRNIYIISKWEKSVKLFELNYPFKESINVAKYVTDLPITKVTSAAMSVDGTEILIRTYNSVYYIKRAINKPITGALQNGNLIELQVEKEPQGEAICFEAHGGGFFTISEKGSSEFVNLNYYKRLNR